MLHPDHFATWQAQFELERVRLLKALVELTAGGVIEQVQHMALPARSQHHTAS